MEYNCNHNIEYNNVTDDEIKDHAYRLDFLKCFNVESYDDSINVKIHDIYEKTKDVKGFIELYDAIRGCYNIVNDHELCLVYLFSYDFFYMFHNILSHYLTHNQILKENVRELVCFIQNK